jgi:pyridinium-3,5-biscarboxylic acid mononucleotide sulfurtransferase
LVYFETFKALDEGKYMVDDVLLGQKTKALRTALQKYLPVAIAFSGGVDSTFLLSETLEVAEDKNQVIAVTADSPVHPKRDLESATAFCREREIRHIVVETLEMHSSDFIANPGNRCYVCKKIIFSSILETAHRLGIQNVAHAVNMDDMAEYRPGLKAADEMHVLAPLVEAGLNKSEIRILSRRKGLPNWNRPASGCLATRIPYGNEITKAKLEKIDSAEQALADIGFSGCRVRYYDDLAKIEVQPGDLKKFMDDSVRIGVL